MARQRVVLSVSDSHMKSFHRVAKAARAAGLSVDQEMPDLGVLTGSIEVENRDALTRIAGVESVEPDREVGISTGATVA